MSHVTIIDLHITDLESLALAAMDCGLEFRNGQGTYKWYGTHVGDYPLPHGFKKSDLGKCEHAIGLPQTVFGRPNPASARAYEVGITRRRDGKPGYQLLWDFFAGGYGLQEAIGLDGVKLRDYYAAHVSAKEMRSKGFSATIKKTDKGVRVVCKR